MGSTNYDSIVGQMEIYNVTFCGNKKQIENCIHHNSIIYICTSTVTVCSSFDVPTIQSLSADLMWKGVQCNLFQWIWCVLDFVLDCVLDFVLYCVLDFVLGFVLGWTGIPNPQTHGQINWRFCWCIQSIHYRHVSQWRKKLPHFFVQFWALLWSLLKMNRCSV